jgi:hypothetical protein
MEQHRRCERTSVPTRFIGARCERSASRKDGSMDSESEIQFLKNRVAALEKDARELDAGLRWVMEELRKKKLLPPPV